jgi:hypothetical protein
VFGRASTIGLIASDPDGRVADTAMPCSSSRSTRFAAEAGVVVDDQAAQRHSERTMAGSVRAHIGV